jgi:hypothetical protein
MKTRQRVMIIGNVVIVAAFITIVGAKRARSEPSQKSDGPANNVLARALAVGFPDERVPSKFGLAPVLTKEFPLAPVSGGVMKTLFDWKLGDEALGLFARTAGGASGMSSVPVPPSRLGSQGCPNVFKGDGREDDDEKSSVDNVRVNQDCSLRRQAEEVVVVNPKNFSNVVAGQNDSRIGYNHCGYDWSLDRGGTWGDTGTAPPPFWQTILLDNHTSDACSDPAATFDADGNVFVAGLLFDIVSPASAIYIAKSNYPIKGRFYHSPFPLSFQEYRTAPMGKVGSDNNPDIFNDKGLMIADTRPGSPKLNRVYFTWTRFETNNTAVGGRSPIVFSQSTDGGANWSRPVIISGASGSFCTAFSGTPDSPNACDQDQGSHPVVGPDGTIYVIFGNGNTPQAGVNQVMMVKCPVANECTTEAGWVGPFRIGDLIGTHPIGPSAEGCPPGNQCLPPNGYRVPEFTSLSISVDRNSNLYATWSDFRNGESPCTPLSPAATARPPCNNDVFYAFSTNGGLLWSPTINVTAKLGKTAQWQPWHDVMGDGSKVQVAFYDRHYGNCEFTGCNDITLATISNPRSAKPSIKFKRITTSSMPNLTTANNPIQAGFLGDYMGVEVSRHNFNQRATHIVWADTRQLFGSAPEEDIYYARVPGDSDRDDDD